MCANAQGVKSNENRGGGRRLISIMVLEERNGQGGTDISYGLLLREFRFQRSANRWKTIAVAKGRTIVKAGRA
jgi:hypothetical protein